MNGMTLSENGVRYEKRYILFGYQIQNGEFCIVQQEGAAVEYILMLTAMVTVSSRLPHTWVHAGHLTVLQTTAGIKYHCPIAFLRHLLRYSNLSRHYHKRTVFPSTATSQWKVCILLQRSAVVPWWYAMLLWRAPVLVSQNASMVLSSLWNVVESNSPRRTLSATSWKVILDLSA